jgi:hypothetical protein
MKAFLLVSLILFQIGCASKLRPDVVPYAVPSGYDSIEILGCNQYSYGTSICNVSPLVPLSSLDLKIKSYYNGKIVVNGCGISENRNYIQSEMVPIALSGNVNGDCVLTVTMSPSLPNQEKTPILVGSLRGHVFIHVQDPEFENVVQFNQVPMGINSGIRFDVPVGGELSGILKIIGRGDGCLVNAEMNITATNGFISIPLDTIHSSTKQTTCVFEGVLDTPSDKYILFWVINYYSKDFIELANPSIEWKSKDKLCVIADTSASIISVDDNYKISNNACFKVDKTKDFILRTLTVGGRTNIGIWDGGFGIFRWYK